MRIGPIIICTAKKLLCEMIINVQKTSLSVIDHHFFIHSRRQETAVHPRHLLFCNLCASHIDQADLIRLKDIPVQLVATHQHLLIDPIDHMHPNAVVRNLYPQDTRSKCFMLHQKFNRKPLRVHLTDHRNHL